VRGPVIYLIPDRFFPIQTALFVFLFLFHLPHFSDKLVQGEGVFGTAGGIREDNLVEIGGGGYR
jgi:hypothetical protein